MRIGNRVWALIAVVSVVACGVRLLAQEDAKTRKAPLPSVEAAWKAVDAKADTLKSKWGEKKTTLMQGNVRFVHGDTILTSDLVDYDGNAKTAASPGPLRIADPECDITGEKGFADLNKKLGIVDGNVVMRLKPKLTPEEEKARQTKDNDNINAKLKEPTTVTCAKLEYQYKAKIATATGGVIFKQEKRTAGADKAIYDRKTEKLTLIGHVKAVDEDGQTFSSPDKVVISLKKGDEWMEGTNTNASFKIDLD